ncbi:MAG: prepilin-type N-terminal cleavage/methylation domain-containing protein [Eubacteriaceae bacterium]|nr:prepilin-type N-terminal cleavage/methylation domain-containing protein [Eubacteriaceae bacterium]
MKENIKVKSKKGFTLVEVIVVLVILAILAAILIPSMIGWINKANAKKNIVQSKNILTAAQAYATEHSEDVIGVQGETSWIVQTSAAEGTPGKEIADLSEMPDDWKAIVLVSTDKGQAHIMRVHTSDNVITYDKAGILYKKGWDIRE